MCEKVVKIFLWLQRDLHLVHCLKWRHLSQHLWSSLLLGTCYSCTSFCTKQRLLSLNEWCSLCFPHQQTNEGKAAHQLTILVGLLSCQSDFPFPAAGCKLLVYPAIFVTMGGWLKCLYSIHVLPNWTDTKKDSLLSTLSLNYNKVKVSHSLKVWQEREIKKL